MFAKWRKLKVTSKILLAECELLLQRNPDILAVLPQIPFLVLDLY